MKKKIASSFLDENNQIRVLDADTALSIAKRPIKKVVTKTSREIELEKENALLRIQLENRPLSSEELEELTKLKKKVEELEELLSKSPQSAKNISLSSLINEEKKKTDSKNKLAIFKKIVADNKQLRG